MGVEEDVKELRNSLRDLREKYSEGTHEVLSITQEVLHKQALQQAKIEVRVDAVEKQMDQLLRLIQGDARSKGMLGQLALLEQTTQALRDSHQRRNNRLEDIRGRLESVTVLTQRFNAIEIATMALKQELDALKGAVKVEEDVIKKDLMVLQKKEAQVQSGWYVTGTIFACLSAIAALLLQLWAKLMR